MPKNREKNEGIIWIEVEEEPSSEEWCFECKDGGELVICDHKNCGKVYHPDCVGKEDSFFDTVESWVCGRHFCSDCNEPPKFYCTGCPYSLCGKCVVVSSEFTVVRGVKGLCIDCLELVQIIEQNLDHDSEGNKITLTDKETYECLFKEYWGVIKAKEGFASDDISAALHSYKKSKKFVHHKNFSKGEEKQNDWSWESGEGYRPAKRKRYNSEEFMGWGSKRLISFLVSIGKYETEPLTQWGVTSLILGYIKEKNLHHPKDKGKFLPDERLRPIFRKKVVSRGQIYSLLEFHFAKKLDDSSMEENDDQIKSCSADKHLNDQKSSMQSRLSRLIGKPLLKKGDLFTSVEKNDDQIKNSSTDKHINDQSTSMRSRLSSLIGKHPLKKGDFFTSVEKNHDQMNNSSTNKHVNDQTTSMQSRLSSLIGKPPMEEGDFFSSVEKNDDQIENSSKDKHVNDQATSIQSRLSSLIGKPPLEKGDFFPSVEKNDDQIENSSEDKHVNDQATSMQSRLSSIIRKPPLKKGDFLIKLSRYASINANNINLIYLKRSLVLELSKQTESFMGKVVGAFVRAKVDSNDSRQRTSHHLVRVEGVVLDEMSNETLLQVSFMAKAIPFSKLSDEEFTEEECEDLRQKVKSSLLPKLTVVEVQEKANGLHEDITKHRILTRLVHLQNQIERANLRGRNKQKIELLEEKEKLEQSWKQEQLLQRVPTVRPDFVEAKYDDAEEHELETDSQD